MLGEMLMALSVFALVVVVGSAVGCWLLFRRLHRANRVVDDRRSPAPLSWLWSWNATARLHRRLRRAVQVVTYVMAPFRPPARRDRRTPPPAPGDLLGVADALLLRAAEIDERLVAASRTAWPWRAGLLRQLASAVGEVEGSVTHLQRVAAAWKAEMDAAVGWQPFPPLDLHSRLGALEAAMAEVSQVAAAGAARVGGHLPPGPTPSAGRPRPW
ncbi:MAG TPA: hypothetical protein VGH66_10940 [Acidimicrobiales bacterium]